MANRLIYHLFSAIKTLETICLKVIHCPLVHSDFQQQDFLKKLFCRCLRHKILQGRLQQCVGREIPEIQAGFRRGRGTRDQIANMHWIMEKARAVSYTHLTLPTKA